MKRDIQRLQSLLNKALCLIHYQDMSISTKDLLRETNQLSINQLIAYRILIQTYKIKETKQPKYHFERLFRNETEASRTRSCCTERIEFKLNIARSSFFYQSNRLWISLPMVIQVYQQ